MNSLFKDTGVIILAGGNSERMNFPKAYLDVNGETMLESIYQAYAGFTNKIEVVMNKKFCEGKWKPFYEKVSQKMHIQQNPHPEYGRFFSLQLGLARMTGKAFCFVQHVDNPVSPDVIEELVRKKTARGYVVPQYLGAGGHPILVSRTIMNAILEADAGSYRLDEFLHAWPKTAVPVNDERTMMNLNTAPEFENYISPRKA